MVKGYWNCEKRRCRSKKWRQLIKKKKEKIITIKQQQPPIEVKFKKKKKKKKRNHKNSNNKSKGAGDKECFWIRKTHNKRKVTHNQQNRQVV